MRDGCDPASWQAAPQLARAGGRSGVAGETVPAVRCLGPPQLPRRNPSVPEWLSSCHCFIRYCGPGADTSQTGGHRTAATPLAARSVPGRYCSRQAAGESCRHSCRRLPQLSCRSACACAPCSGSCSNDWHRRDVRYGMCSVCVVYGMRYYVVLGCSWYVGLSYSRFFELYCTLDPTGTNDH
jgi:hypothetical protein